MVTRSSGIGGIPVLSDRIVRQISFGDKINAIDQNYFFKALLWHRKEFCPRESIRSQKQMLILGKSVKNNTDRYVMRRKSTEAII